MRLTKKIIEDLSNPDNNMLSVEDFITFISPAHSAGIFIALRVRHKQSGLRYIQLLHMSNGVASELGETLVSHAEMAQPQEPDL